MPSVFGTQLGLLAPKLVVFQSPRLEASTYTVPAARGSARIVRSRPLLSLALLTPFWKRVMLVGPSGCQVPLDGELVLCSRAASSRISARSVGVSSPPMRSFIHSMRPSGDSA